jgi:hypothetical protein
MLCWCSHVNQWQRRVARIDLYIICNVPSFVKIFIASHTAVPPDPCRMWLGLLLPGPRHYAMYTVSPGHQYMHLLKTPENVAKDWRSESSSRVSFIGTWKIKVERWADGLDTCAKLIPHESHGDMRHRLSKPPQTCKMIPAQFVPVGGQTGSRRAMFFGRTNGAVGRTSRADKYSSTRLTTSHRYKPDYRCFKVFWCANGARMASKKSQE